MAHIFVVSATPDVQEKVRDQLKGSRAEDAGQNIYFGHPNKIHQELKKKFDVVIYQSSVLNDQIKEFPLICRKLGYEGPIVVLCPTLPENTKDLRLDGVVYIDNPFEKQNLKGVVKNVIEKSEISQRKFRRFDIEEKVEIELYETKFKTKATIHNISRGGLYLHGAFDGLKIGDLIRVHFDLEEINKQRSMSAKVAWIQPSRVPGEEIAAGVEFVSQLVVYNYLLKYAV